MESMESRMVLKADDTNDASLMQSYGQQDYDEAGTSANNEEAGTSVNYEEADASTLQVRVTNSLNK